METIITGNAQFNSCQRMRWGKEEGATAWCRVKWRGLRRAAKRRERTSRDCYEVAGGRERSWCCEAVISADHRQRGLSYHNTPAPHFVPWQTSLSGTKKLIISTGGLRLLNKQRHDSARIHHNTNINRMSAKASGWLSLPHSPSHIIISQLAKEECKHHSDANNFN